MGENKARYKTKQRDLIVEFFRRNPGTHFTVARITELLRKSGTNIGASTVYRQVERLVEEETVAKYIVEPGEAACYKYIRPDYDSMRDDEFHFKCVKCGKFFHIRCDELGGISNHILNSHHFKIDPLRTVFYGECEECLNDGKSE